ncbi:MAG TPA: PAS domain S-box protein [Pyrinomonadaceae bacterium]|nr:PAS domain S-box protein [Pyrinomonadaceae bacterium]
MEPRQSRNLAGYVIAVGSVVLAWLLREALTPIWGPNSLPFIFFFPAVVLTAWYGRLRLALLSIGVSAMLANYFFLEPRHTFGISNAGEAVGISAFVICSVAVAYGIESMHRANARVKRAVEEVQQASEASAHLAAVVTSSSDAIVSKTLEGVVRTWNDGARRVFGYTPDEMIGQPIRRLIPAEIQPEEDFILARVRAGERIEHYETVRVRKDGERIDVSLTISPIKNSAGEIIGASKIARDVTDRKRVEEALRENEERLRMATETGKVGIWDWDIQTDRISWTDSLYQMHGVNKDEVLGIDSFASLIHPEDRTRVSQALEQALKGNTPYELEFRVVKPNGETGWVFTNAVVFREDDKPTRLVGVTLDITDRKRAESELDAVLAREQELRRAAEQANRLKDEFLATMSHELRNPLNVILGYSELLLRAEEFRNSPQLARMGEALRRNALAQSHLIRDLLDLSRLRSGKLTLNGETISIMTAINNAVETVRADAAAKQIEIQIDAPDGALFVEGDLLRVEQIVWNLLTNSVKFTPAGGRILLRAVREAEDVVLSVTDTGQGIDPTFLPYVFEMFRQADASTSRAQSGMGIGLALVRQLVELHGGKVDVKSAGVGLGTCFTVWLPHSTRGRMSVAPVLDFTPEQLGKLDVLVLDDSEDTTEMLRHLLEQNGALVTTATNGLDALRIASEREFDIVLSDISMPGMDGFEFVRRLRELPGKKDVPVLALTGFGRPEDITRAQNEGFFTHLTKPFDVKALGEILQRVPSRRRSSQVGTQ